MASQQAFVVEVDGGWGVKVAGTVESGPHRTQGEAQDAARTWLLGNGGGELVTLGEDGKIRSKDTIGRDDPRGNG
jgi:hypothetical protein